jgi:hypothetical protein
MRRDEERRRDAEERRARAEEVRRIRDATSALRDLARAAGGGAGLGGILGSVAGNSPWAAALGAVTLAVSEMRRIQQRSNQETGAIIRGQISTGSSSGEVARTAAEFRAIGFDTGRIIELADQFRERVWSDPIAVGAFGRQVIPERLGGTESSIAVLREGLAILGKETNETARRMRAARFQLKDFLLLFDIPPAQREALLRAADAQGGAIDPALRGLRGARDAQNARIQIRQDTAAQETEKRWLRIRNWAVEMYERARQFRDSGGLPGIIGRSIPGKGPSAFEERKAKKDDPQTRATTENTKALYNLKEEWAQSRRAAGAVPGGLRGLALQKALDDMGAQGYWLGAFSQH